MKKKTFTERLLILFGQPNSIDDDELIAEYERLLKSYSPEIVDAAIDRLARSYKYPGWPKVADCVEAAEDAIEGRNWQERAKNGGDPVRNDHTRKPFIEAKRFINGPGGHGWEWSPAFRDHPWVILAEKEGWGRELRGVCFRQAYLRFAGGVHRDGPTTENVMPDAELVAYFRAEAKKGRDAAEWREANPNHRSIKGWQPIDVSKLLQRNRETFEAEQRVVRDPTGEAS